MTTLTVHPQARGLIFDLDGTLADSMPVHAAAWHAAFAHFGVTCPQVFLDRLTGMPAFETVECFNQEFGTTVDPSAVAVYKEAIVHARLAEATRIVPVAEIALRNAGVLPIAVATGGVRVNAELLLEAIGLTGLFNIVVTADDPVRPKPAPDIFLEAARRMGVAPERCQVFEDGVMGLEAGRRAGMIVTDVRPFLNGATKQTIPG